MSLTRRLGQIALGIPFMVLGYQAAADPGPRVGAAADLGLPEPETLVKFNGVAMSLGGVAMAANIFPRPAALGLAASLVPTTLAGHAFWTSETAEARAGQQIQFLKNVGLIGGLLAFAATRARQ